MPRQARESILGTPYHVTARGNNRSEVFLCDQDYEEYLSLLRTNSRRFGLDILAYCLMPNHVHLIAIPRKVNALSLAIGRVNSRYALRFNHRHLHSGHLWQARFFSEDVEEAGVVPVLQYIELNPVRAGLAKFAWEYPWSSAAAHIGAGDPTGLLNLPEWFSSMEGAIWREMLTLPDEQNFR